MLHLFRTASKLNEKIKQLEEEKKSLVDKYHAEKNKAEILQEINKKIEAKLINQGEIILHLEKRLQKDRDPKTGRYIKKSKEN
jgi:hypothetical protein